MKSRSAIPNCLYDSLSAVPDHRRKVKLSEIIDLGREDRFTIDLRQLSQYRQRGSQYLGMRSMEPKSEAPGDTLSVKEIIKCPHCKMYQYERIDGRPRIAALF